MNRIPLGRFDLIEPLAAGGMGVVWRGVHRSDGTPVAVKVLTPSAAGREEFIIALREEIRAVAGLNHPNVIWIYDHGEVTAEAEELSGGQIKEGGPWLALEFCEGKTLRELAPKLDWEGIRAVLLELLDALAHAHAHGVIHRDIKLANVLVGGARPGIKLTDFGIMYAVDKQGKGDSAAPVNAGTPAYMAPEQLLGWEDTQGPWTDIYQFGVMAWKLITWGCPAEGDVRQLLIAKNAEDWVPFQPVVPVPDGVEGWLRRLMKRWPEERYRSAADAAYHLQHLGNAPPGEKTLPDSLWDADATTMMGPEDLIDNLPDARPRERDVEVVPHPFPRDWREVETDATLPTALIGAGLRLFGVRKVPVIGREAERDALWAGFAGVHRTRTPRVVVLRGPLGSGKSHIADWMCRKVEEVGGGIALRGPYAHDRTDVQGAPLALLRYLRCVGADRDEVARKVDTLFDRFGVGDEQEAARLVAVLAPGEDGEDGPRVEFRNRAEKFELICRVLERLARERPVLLFLDDVHYGRDGVRFARHLLRRGPSAIMVLLTVRDDVLARVPADAERLRAVERFAACASVYVGPLSKEHRAEFVQRLLGLEPKLARRLADKTAGNPAVAAQILSDWVERGLLEASSTGFRLTEEGASLPMPDNVHDSWHVRIGRLLRTHEEDWRIPLEIAATLGMQVHTAEWQRVCQVEGVTVPRPLLTTLLKNHYVVMDDASRGRSWEFAHSMFREAVLEEARGSGRLEVHHRAAVTVLEGAVGGRKLARLAWHLLGAGETLEAIDPLLDGAAACLKDGDHEEATRLLDAREQTMVNEGVRPSDTRWGRGWLMRARLHIREGEWRDSAVWTEKTIEVGKDWGWHDLRIEALALMGGNMREGDASVARQHLAQARRLLEEGGNERSRTTVALLAAKICLGLGRLKEASAWGRRALASARRSADDQLGECLRVLTQVETARGNLPLVEKLMREADRHAATAGSRYDEAQVAFLRGNFERHRGDLEAARVVLEKAWELSQAIADPNRMVVRATQGLLQVERDRLEQARSLFRPCLRSQVPQAQLWAHVGMLVYASTEPDDTLWSAHLNPVLAFLERGWSDVAIARYGRMAADRAFAAGYDDRAEDATLLVQAQDARMGAIDPGRDA